jgi:hypothetical protein
MNDYIVTDVYSTELGIRLSFVKTFEFGGGVNTTPPPRYATVLGHLAYGVTPCMHFCCPIWIVHLFPRGCKIRFHYFFFKFALAGKNLHKVEFTYVEYYLSRGVAVCVLVSVPVVLCT